MSWFQKQKKEQKKETLGDSIRSMVVAVFIALLIRTFLFQPFVIPSGSMKPTLLIGDFIFVTKFTYGYTKHSLPFSVPLIPGRLLEKKKPQIGDVVVFRGPYDPDTDYIKRVVGLPGDRIQMREGILYINDQAANLEPAGTFTDDVWTKRLGKDQEERIASSEQERKIEQYLETLPNGVKHYILKRDKFGEGMLDNTQEYVVPEGHYFMIGDNRDESGDSRILTQIGYVPENHIIGQAQIIWFSTKALWWEIWKWLTSIRYSRLFAEIQ